MSFRSGLKGSYFALITLAFAELLRVLANSVEFTGGGVGLFLTYAPGLSNLQFETPVGFYYFALILMFISIAVVYWLESSRFGAQLVAIRENEDAAEALGINLFKYKMYAFALSSFYAGIAGSILFIISGGIEPGSFSLLYSITFIAIVIIGGVGTVLGPLYGAFFFTMLPGIIQILLHLIGVADTDFFLNAGEIERIIFGFFIIFFLVFEPRGIWGIWFRLRNYFKAWPFSY